MIDRCRATTKLGQRCSRSSAFRRGGYCEHHWQSLHGHRWVRGICGSYGRHQLATLGSVCDSQREPSQEEKSGMSDDSDLPEHPTVHSTEMGGLYVLPIDLLNSKSGRRELRKFYDADILGQRPPQREGEGQ